ncbi:hypothetical protein CHS0354_027838 [Potamilus streckersoni]|uniref:Uncharacterized protein n=1 Tax=Potamilus streckersoni TaxID=2493646 RepID=A0AAE0W4U9_9BIVA|nr:hypothetical protein CHS0354_027838 [Potamilus streckersoni]
MLENKYPNYAKIYTDGSTELNSSAGYNRRIRRTTTRWVPYIDSGILGDYKHQNDFCETFRPKMAFAPGGTYISCENTPCPYNAAAIRKFYPTAMHSKKKEDQMAASDAAKIKRSED